MIVSRDTNTTERQRGREEVTAHGTTTPLDLRIRRATNNQRAITDEKAAGENMM